MIPSRLDRQHRPGPPRFDPCPATRALDDGTEAKCEGMRGHEGPHVARVTLAWEETEAAEE